MKYLIFALTIFAIQSVAHAQSCPTPPQLDSDLTAASQAATISLSGVDPATCPQISMQQTWSGGKLIFSDSPESPSVKAKMYDDPTLAATVAGTNNRIFVYHVNGASSGKMKFAVVVKNLGNSTATLTVQQSGIAGPSTSYLYVGKVAFDRWLTSTAGTPVSVPVGGVVQLDSTFNSTQAAVGYLMEGIWDYQMDQPHEVMVCALAANDNVLSVCPGLGVAARDVHQRGTYPYADKIYDTATGVTVDTAGDIQQFPLASGAVNDDWAVGTDVTDGSQQTLKGNYGVLYRSHLNLVSSDGRNMGILINPRGGTWGGAVFAAPGLLAGGKFLIPPTTGSNGDPTKASVEGRYSPGAGFTAWYQFMPTGGSSFPVRMVLVPH